jgi:hypothetical protein
MVTIELIDENEASRAVLGYRLWRSLMTALR